MNKILISTGYAANRKINSYILDKAPHRYPMTKKSLINNKFPQQIFLIHRSCCRVTQLLHQPLHIYKIYKIYTLKH